MTLLQLISYLKTLDKTEALVQNVLPGVIVDQVDIYLEDSLSPNAEVHFFDAETIDNKLEIEINSKKMTNLFPLYMAQEMVEEYINKDETLSDFDIVKKLIDYRIKDA